MAKRNWLGLVLLLGICVLTAHFLLFYQPPSDKVVIGGVGYQLEVVADSASRQRGLSGRDDLPTGNGMLFVFNGEANHGIWMKDMNFAIDIIWLDTAQKVVSLATDVSPDSYPKVWRAQTDSKFVIEIDAGEVDQAGLMIGDLINLEPLLSTHPSRD